MSYDPYTLRQMLIEHGSVATLIKRSNNTYDVDTGSMSQATTNYSVRMYQFDYEYDKLSPDNIQTGMSRVIIGDNLAGKTTPVPVPDTTDQIVFNNKTYDIVKVSRISSNSKICCYLCDVRG